jgi:hypothetical protein
LSNGTVDRVVEAARVFHVAADQLEKVRAGAKPDANIDTAYLDELGMMGGATVLEAMALKLVLKARLVRAGTRPPKWHSHFDLFGLLPDAEQQEAEQSYQTSRGPEMQPTLAEALDLSAKAFERWRFHQELPAEARLAEMRAAFNVLVAPLPSA